MTARAYALLTVLAVLLATAAASAAPAPVCATAKRTVIAADGTIHVITRTVCVVR